MSLVFVVMRSNLAWRRSSDARGPRWILGGYIVLLAVFALLQAATFLVYDFGGDDNSNLGLNMLGLSLIGLWAVILAGKPVGGPRDPDANADVGNAGPVPQAGFASPQMAAPMRAADVRAMAQAVSWRAAQSPKPAPANAVRRGG